METFYKIVEIILFAWFGFTVVYVFFYAIMSLFYKERKLINKNEKSAQILVLIPAYKEDKVILNTLKAISNQDYPIDKYKVMLIADHFDKETILDAKKYPVDVLDVSFEKSTKSIAINYALSLAAENTELVAILDADNLVEANFLKELNLNFQNGDRAIQGQRIAKNSNTSYAILDAIGEEINNSIYCKGQQFLGFTSRLTGSGMAFEFNLFKKLMSGINAIGGFDKELELNLLENNVSIFYNSNIKIYDEKVTKSTVLMNQRSRWISAQFHYMKKFSKIGLEKLFLKGDVEYFNKYLQLFLLPKMLMVIFLILGLIINQFLLKEGILSHWFFATAIFILSYILVFPVKYLKLNLLKMIYIIPLTILKMFAKLPKLYTANKQFIHTPHES